MRKLAAERGVLSALYIDSAGTHGYHAGSPPDHRAIAAARKRGIELEHLRARLVQADDFHHFDYILAMDRANLALLEGLQPPHSRAKLDLMLAYSQLGPDGDVPDPYYGDAGGFERVLDLLEDAADGLLSALQKRS